MVLPTLYCIQVGLALPKYGGRQVESAHHVVHIVLQPAGAALIQRLLELRQLAAQRSFPQLGESTGAGCCRSSCMPTAARPAASWAAQDCCARGWVPSASCTLYCSACCNRMLCGGGPARINPWDLLCPLRRFLPLLSLQVSSWPPAKPPSPCFRAWRAPAVVSAQVIHRYQISRNVPQQGHVVVYCVQNRRNCLPGGTRQLAQRWLQSPHAQVAIAMHCPAASIHVSKPLPLSWYSRNASQRSKAGVSDWA